jgi:hypothetical protein
VRLLNGAQRGAPESSRPLEGAPIASIRWLDRPQEPFTLDTLATRLRATLVRSSTRLPLPTDETR